MGRYLFKRILWIIPVILGVAVLIFTIMFFTPGDPVKIMLGSDATVEAIAETRHNMGLDRSFLAQLGDFLYQIFFRLNLGNSYYSSRSVMVELLRRFPYTCLLAGSSMLISLLVGIPIGVLGAVKQGSFRDRGTMVLALVGVSMPQFWIGLLLVLLFALKLGVLPASGIGGIQHLILPITANCLGGIAGMARQTRSSMLEVIRSDYVTTAKAKGVSENARIYHHALPNALLPVVTVAGASFGRSLGGTVVIETVFSIPGIGMYMINGINNRDLPIVRGSVVFLAITFSIIMLLVDIAYAYIDPRIKARYTKRK